MHPRNPQETCISSECSSRIGPEIVPKTFPRIATGILRIYFAIIPVVIICEIREVNFEELTQDCLEVFSD